MNEVVSCRFGEKEAVRGSGFGPCTAHDNFMVEDEGKRADLGAGGVASSRYADPLADGMIPV